MLKELRKKRKKTIVLWSSILSNKFGYIMLDKPFFFQSMEIQIPILLQIEINSI